MTDQKVYFSKAIDSWTEDDSDFAWFFYVPRRWLSIKAWKLMWSLRGDIHVKLFTEYSRRTP